MASRLRSLPGRIGRVDLRVVQTPPKVPDAFYNTPEWAALRKATLDRAGWQCEIKGPKCTGVASIADHVVSRRNGGADSLANLRAACRACDNRFKEDHLGERRGNR